MRSCNSEGGDSPRGACGSPFEMEIRFSASPVDGAPVAKGWVFISSHYVNAWGLADLIRASGWSGRIVCLRRTREPAVLMSLYGRRVEVWEVPEGEGLVDYLAKRVPIADPKWLFSTEERSVEELHAGRDHPWVASTSRYPGPECRLDEILDRFRFYALIADKGFCEVPKTIPADRDPRTVFGERFYFRYRRTWVRGRRTPVNRLVDGPAAWDAMRREGEQRGYGPDDWCYQEVLSMAPGDNVSVCGWHDETDPRYVATHKILQFPDRQGNGDVVERIALAPELERSTRSLLNELRFTGPFELEFIRDSRTGRYCAIELNPRFWMQHPLTGGHLGQVLVRRYLGLEGEAREDGLGPLYWVNTTVALNRLLRMDFRGVSYLLNRRTIRVPPVGVTLRWLPRFARNLVHRRLHR